MSPAQKAKYFRDFQKACRANAWTVQGGCVLNAEPLPTLPEMTCAVLTAAARIAAGHHRAVTLDDIRHGVHVIATRGVDRSSKQLTNDELSRVFLLLRLLIDPDDLEAVNLWIHPELEQQRKYLAVIRQAPAAIVQAICRNTFDTTGPDGLTNEQLRTLVIILSNRRDRAQRAMGRKEAA